MKVVEILFLSKCQRLKISSVVSKLWPGSALRDGAKPGVADGFSYGMDPSP